MKKIIGGFMALSACLTGCNDGTINEDQGRVERGSFHLTLSQNRA